MARIHVRGRDPWGNPSKPTQWQQERKRGSVLPMVRERRSILRLFRLSPTEGQVRHG